MERLDPGPAEAVAVVQLQRLPRLAPVGVQRRVPGGAEGRHGHLVGLDVVGVRVAALLVVGGDDVRLEGAHDLDQRRRGLLGRHQVEGVGGQRDAGVGEPALGQAGVDEAEPVLPDAEDLPGPVHLLGADARQVLLDLGAVHLGVEHVAALAPGAGHHQHLDTFADVARHSGGALARLVVRVRVNTHQAQGGGRVRHGV